MAVDFERLLYSFCYIIFFTKIIYSSMNLLMSDELLLFLYCYVVFVIYIFYKSYLILFIPEFIDDELLLFHSGLTIQLSFNPFDSSILDGSWPACLLWQPSFNSPFQIIL